MRWRIFVVFFLFFLKGYSQKRENEYKIMLDSAVSIKSRAFVKSDKSSPNSEAYDKEDLYLIDENDLPYKYSGILTGLQFKAISVLDPKNKSVLNKGIRAWKIIPVLQGSSLKISIINFFITYRSGGYQYANGGGSETIFEYLCSENKWVLAKSKNQGL
jgi:hypothetical protein